MDPGSAGRSRLASLEPDPKSRMRAICFIGYSATIGRVLTVIAPRDGDGDLHLTNAWPATGADEPLCREETNQGEDDGW